MLRVVKAESGIPNPTSLSIGKLRLLSEFTVTEANFTETVSHSGTSKNRLKVVPFSAIVITSQD